MMLVSVSGCKKGEKSLRGEDQAESSSAVREQDENKTDAEISIPDEDFESEDDYYFESDSEDDYTSEDDDDYFSESSEDSYESDSETEYQRIGAENYGYIDVPADWVKFNEIGMSDAEMIQYSDITAQSVITLQYYEGVDAETAASNVYVSMEGQCEGLTAAMVELGGYEAYQVYCFYPDSAEFLVCWLFDGDDGYTHYLAIEGTDMSVFDLSETYSLYE